jgi:thioredoxin-related protein
MKLIIPVLLASVLAVAFTYVSKSKSVPEIHSKTDSAQGIRFIEGDWDKALREAKSQKKLIFLDAYASWCGPCKLLKKKTFPDKTAGDFFNANFINVAVDMEKGAGPGLAEKFNVTAFPTLIIADANGNIITYTLGYMGPDQLIGFGKYGLGMKGK